MTREEIFKVVDAALIGGCPVRIVFKPREIIDVAYLVRMRESGMIVWDESQNIVIGDLLRQGEQYTYEWFGQDRPMVVIKFTEKFDEYFFMKYMTNAIDTIELCFKKNSSY